MERLPPKSVPSTLDAIGMTPVVQLRKFLPKGSADVFVKLEFFNPTGSYRDRMALNAETVCKLSSICPV